MDAGDVNSKLVLADPHITVLPDGEDAFNLGAEAFAQRSDLSDATRYAAADVAFLEGDGRSSLSASWTSTSLNVDGVTYQAIEGTDRVELLSFKPASSIGVKHAEWMPTDAPGAAPCVITIRTAVRCPTPVRPRFFAGVQAAVHRARAALLDTFKF